MSEQSNEPQRQYHMQSNMQEIETRTPATWISCPVNPPGKRAKAVLDLKQSSVEGLEDL